MNRKWLYLPVSVVIIDLITKYLAFTLLKEEELYHIYKLISLTLTLNTTPYNSSLINLGMNNSLFLLFGSLVFIFFGILGIFLPKIIKKKWIRVLTYILMEYILSILAVNYILESKIELKIPYYYVTILKNIGPIFAAIVFFIKLKEPFYKICWGVYLGGGIGNTIGLFIPPFSIIDFIYIRNEYNVGIFNLADVFITGAGIFFILYALLQFLIFIFHRAISFIKFLFNKRPHHSI